jgi:hypothetical protein
MPPINRFLFLVGLLVGGAFAQEPKRRFPPDIAPPEVTQWRDPLRISPEHYKLESSNEHVRVLRLALKGDQVVPMHDDRDSLLVCFTECHLHLLSPDGRIQDIHLEAGKTQWVFGGARSETNLSAEPLEMIVIEMK